MQKLLRRVSSIFKNVKTTLLVLLIALGIMGAIGTAVSLSGASVPVLEPRGEIARQQKDLLVIATLLMLIVVVPVFVLTFVISLKYRASNKTAGYRPEWDSNKKLEALWWGVPMAIIAVLATITWISSHSLDPFRPLDHPEKPLRIQVVALQWKWLFIYPEEQIASINEVVMPVNRPVSFEITSDAPMNSFWIPSLAGQVYAMSGMATKLHVIGDTVGSYKGVSANLSGEGFADMRFNARVVSSADYGRWTTRAQATEHFLTRKAYDELAKPSKGDSSRLYILTDNGLFDYVIRKYTMPSEHAEGTLPEGTKPSDGGTTEQMTHENE